jgi:hypothetical protein
MAEPTKIGGHLLRELSVEVPCDPRTLKKALAGGNVSPLRLVAIRRTLEARGMAGLLPDHSSPRSTP